MKKTNIHLVGGIFSVLSSVGLIIIIATLIGTISAALHTQGHALVKNSAAAGIGAGMIAGAALTTIGGIGSFISGIIQVVKSGESPVKGFAITAGILNILGGVFFIGAVFSFISHTKQD